MLLITGTLPLSTVVPDKLSRGGSTLAVMIHYPCWHYAERTRKVAPTFATVRRRVNHAAHSHRVLSRSATVVGGFRADPEVGMHPCERSRHLQTPKSILPQHIALDGCGRIIAGRALVGQALRQAQGERGALLAGV